VDFVAPHPRKLTVDGRVHVTSQALSGLALGYSTGTFTSAADLDLPVAPVTTTFGLDNVMLKAAVTIPAAQGVGIGMAHMLRQSTLGIAHGTYLRRSAGGTALEL